MRRGPEIGKKKKKKYLFAEFFSEKPGNIPDQTVYEYKILGQKLGYDRCPYLCFFVWRFEEKFLIWRQRDFNTKYVIFYPKILWNTRDARMNAGHQRWFDWERINNKIPEFFEERDPTPLGGNVVSQGKWLSTIVLIVVWRQKTSITYYRDQ